MGLTKPEIMKVQVSRTFQEEKFLIKSSIWVQKTDIIQQSDINIVIAQ